MDVEKFFKDNKVIVLLATISCALWGSAYPAIKVGYKMFNIAAEDTASKLLFAGYRFAMAGIMVLVVGIFMKKEIFKFSKKQFGQMAFLGVIQTAIQYVFFYIGLAYATGAKSSIINGTVAFFSVIIAHFVYKNDKLNKNKAIGCLIGFIGIIVLNLDLSTFDFTFKLKGEGFGLIAAVMFSIGPMYGKKLTNRLDPVVVTGYNLLTGGVTLVVLGYIFKGNLVGLNLGSATLLVYMAFLSAVAFTLWTGLMKYNRVGKIAIFNFLIPIFGSILSAIFLFEDIWNIKSLMALICVCFGIWMVYKE
jgi:drug/metabolite transporter (DMT)-like permease